MGAMTTDFRRPIPAVMALALAVVWTSGAALADSRSSADWPRVLERASAAGHPPPYRALRRLEAGTPGSGRQGWLEAWTELTPARGFRYDVIAEGGSEYVRNKVLRGVLNGEQKLLARGEALRAAFVAANYAFEDGGATDAGLQRILLKPVRKGAGIVVGSVVIDPVDGRLVQVQGRLVKNPSFWVRNADVVWKFERFGEATVPVEVSTTARVRMFGESTFTMTYEYVSMEGREIHGQSHGDKRPKRD